MMTARPTPENHSRWWVHDASAEELHALPSRTINLGNSPEVDVFSDFGVVSTAMCGMQTHWWPPGPVSGASLPRCIGCCRSVGVAEGKGTPANEGKK